MSRFKKNKGDNMKETKRNMKTKKSTTQGERIQGAGNSSNRQNTSSTRGGTADMDQRSVRDAAGNKVVNTRGSGISTKNTVTGSDFDGQLSDL
jgi:hypothetical protein